jgi:hypothetical protein
MFHHSIYAALKGIRWKLVIVWLGGAIALIAISFSLGRSAHGYKRLPTILATLAGSESGFDDGVNARIRELFPAGSREDELIDYLVAEGFEPEWPRRNVPNAGRYVHDGIICTKMVRILWQANERGALTDVSGRYASSCALDRSP